MGGSRSDAASLCSLKLSSDPLDADLSLVTVPEDSEGATTYKIHSMVRITGPCVSACTLILQVPNERICIGRYAALGFHAPTVTLPVSNARQEAFFLRAAIDILWRAYPPPIRKWITEHGGLTGRLRYLTGPALRGLFRACK